jgi:Zn-dependent protease
MFIEYAAKDPYFFFSWMAIIVFSICYHEFAHAQVALWRGDDTAARLGHLSLNPLVQMGWTSLIMLMLIGIAWGSVPVNVNQLRGRYAHAQVAAGGPLANLLLCVVFSLVGAVVQWMGLAQEIERFFRLAAMANAVLFLFNLIPIPLFDGWTVLSAFIAPLRRIDLRLMSQYFWVFLLVIWTTGVMDGIWRAGSALSDTITGATLSVLNFIGN